MLKDQDEKEDLLLFDIAAKEQSLFTQMLFSPPCSAVPPCPFIDTESVKTYTGTEFWGCLPPPYLQPLVILLSTSMLCCYY